MSDLLTVRGLRLGFGKTEVVHGVDLQVLEGPYGLGVIGESGSGKTTIGRAVLRLHPALAGSITYRGRDVLAMTRVELSAYRREVQLVFQDGDGALDPRMSVQSAIAEPLAIHRTVARGGRRDRVAALLAEVGLGSDLLARYPHELSGGERQRVVIARALALEPKLLVLDEPTSALDVTVQERVLQLIERLREHRSLGYILISHNLAVIDRLCESCVVLYQGAVVERGRTRDLLTTPLHPYTRALRAAVPELGVGRPPSTSMLTVGPPQTSSVHLPVGQGCSYADRCPLAVEICRSQTPVLREVAGREIACHRAEDSLSL